MSVVKQHYNGVRQFLIVASDCYYHISFLCHDYFFKKKKSILHLAKERTYSLFFTSELAFSLLEIAGSVRELNWGIWIVVPNWNLWSLKFSIFVFYYIYFGFIVLPHVKLLTALFCVLWYWDFTQGFTRARQGFYQGTAYPNPSIPYSV